MKPNFHVSISDSFLPEDVDVTGTLQVLTRADATGNTPKIDVYASLSDTTAVGLETGDLFRVEGAQHWLDQQLSTGDFAWESLAVTSMQSTREAREAKAEKFFLRMRLGLSFTSSLSLLAVDVTDPCSECGLRGSGSASPAASGPLSRVVSS